MGRSSNRLGRQKRKRATGFRWVVCLRIKDRQQAHFEKDVAGEIV